jgi:integrase
MPANDVLTDRAVRNARAETSPRKLFDGGGLYLLVNADGAKYWRFKYRIDGRERLISFGALIRAIRGYRGSEITRCALQLAPLVFVRPGELQKAEWKEIDLAKAE